jgi:hypothetical protein
MNETQSLKLILVGDKLVYITESGTMLHLHIPASGSSGYFHRQTVTHDPAVSEGCTRALSHRQGNLRILPYVRLEK